MEAERCAVLCVLLVAACVRVHGGRDVGMTPHPKPCDPVFSVVITQFMQFDNDSILALDEYPIMYPQGMYWKEVDVIRGCLCLLTNCVRKCCPENQILSGSECVDSERKFNPISTDGHLIVDNDTTRVMYGNPCGGSANTLNALVEFNLLSNGMLITEKRNFSSVEYCLEENEEGKMLPLLCSPMNQSSLTEENDGRILSLLYSPTEQSSVIEEDGEDEEEDENEVEERPCNNHNKYLSVEITEYITFENGSMLAMDQYPMLYPEGMYWEEPNEDNETVVRGCLCQLTTCIRKCCPENMTHSSAGCVPSNNSLLYPFAPQFFDYETKILVKNMSSDLRVLYGNPCASDSYRIDPLDPEEHEEFFLLPTGQVRTHEDIFSVAEYCLEAFDDVQRILPLACFPPDEMPLMEDDPNVYVLYPIGMITSLPFLFVTFCVYAVIPELRNLHGKSLMCHVTTLFVGYVFLAIVQIGGNSVANELCVVSAFAIYFSFHASFFWLNVMCFDIWWTFSGLRPLRGSVKEREYKKFVMYSCYAWGAPLIMLSVCLLMHLEPNIPDHYIKPEFGTTKCWFGSDDAVLAYFFGPIGVIVLCNIILFIATAIRIIHLKKETKMLKGGESKRHDEEANRQRFNLYLKLFIVMGVNWIMEVISWAAGGPSYLWYITDLGNTLQGVLIFVIFVWKHKIRRLLMRRFFPKWAGTSGHDGSVRSQPTPSRTSSYNYTCRTSISTHDQLVLKPVPNGSYRYSDVP